MREAALEANQILRLRFLLSNLVLNEFALLLTDSVFFGITWPSILLPEKKINKILIKNKISKLNGMSIINIKS